MDLSIEGCPKKKGVFTVPRLAFFSHIYGMPARKDHLLVTLFSSDAYQLGEEIFIIFEITNNSKRAVRILKWFTPLEELKSHCLVVSRRGRKRPIDYDGMRQKRPRPGELSYVTVKSGESISRKITLTDGYSIGTKGRYQVGFDPNLLTVKPASNKGKTLPILQKPASFSVTAGGSPVPSAGEKARNATAMPRAMVQAAAVQLQGQNRLLPKISFVGGDATQQAQVQNAHQNAYNLAVTALSGMADNANYQMWFGDYGSDNGNAVRQSLHAIIGQFESQPFIYDLTGTSCPTNSDPDDNYYGYSYYQKYTIWLCSRFWDAPDLGRNSKAGCLLHEHSHVSANTFDWAGDPTACKVLAVNQPTQAVTNADSYEYFAGG